MGRRIIFFLLLAFQGVPFLLPAQPVTPRKYDLTRQPVLYTVGYAHLDTQWRWDYDETVTKFLKNTLDENFRMFEKYPDYVFTFSGARRYKMMKEYYPGKYELLKKYIREGRWFVGGSSVDECDVNIPSPESVIRQVLYGNDYFRSEFGKESVDFLLPDCFGFPAHLPSALSHAGLRGFSTQKLEWGSAAGIPFNIGNWKGPDGNFVVAALNATDYTGEIEPGLDTVSYWANRIHENSARNGVQADYRYYGVGDVGGAPREKDIQNAVKAAADTTGKFRVYLASSDQLFRDLTVGEVSRFPEYTGDLLLTEHSAGSLTSQAYMKRWNRKNELLAQAAEPLAVMADWLRAIPYPMQALNEGWWLVLGSQMHDILPGTCIPKAYEYAWNDEVVALNRFSSVLEASAGGVIRAMDTQTKGECIVVYNPLSIPREDLVEADIPYPGGAPSQVSVADPSGTIVPSQIISKTKTSLKVVFLARVPSMGLAVFDLQPAKEVSAQGPGVTAGRNYLENEYYKVVVNSNGDITSIFDKKLNRELLSGPARQEFLKEHPDFWPAWNMDWKDRKNPAIAYAGAPASITLTEPGPVRATLRIEREGMGSKFVTLVQLCAGEAGQHVEIRNTVWWQSKGVSLKASFPLTVKNNVATYNLGLGTIQRENNNEKKYEVPSREWFDLTGKSGAYGVTILEDCKFGSDKPNDSTLRLTLLYTPQANSYQDQATQDWGIHEFSYGIYSHKGDWKAGASAWQGRRFNQPLRAFLATPHPGFLGKSFSFVTLSSPAVGITAIKKSETGKSYIIRVQEMSGEPVDKVELRFSGKYSGVWMTDGQERPTANVRLQNSRLFFDMPANAIRSIAFTLAPNENRLYPATSIPVTLPYDQTVTTPDTNRKATRIGNLGVSIPKELFPGSVTADGISFSMAPDSTGPFNAMSCRGQKIQLPKTGYYNKVYILAAATKDTSGLFRCGESKKTLRIQAITGKAGQFENRTWDKMGRINGLEPGFIKRDEIAWYATHLHGDTADIPYQYAYLFKYELDASPSAGYIQLPENDAIRIFAITVAENPYDHVTPAQPLYDDFSGHKKMDLNLGVRYVTGDMVPAMTLSTSRKRNLDDLPVKVSMKDYAGIHMPNGVTARYYNLPAKGKALAGEPITALNDGMFDLLPADSAKDAWYETGESRWVMDLQKTIEIDSLHLFASLEARRGPVRFSLWGRNSTPPQDVSGDPKTTGWSFISEVPQVDVWGNGKAVYRLTASKENKTQYRYLMWVSEDSGHGPYYFREIDVFERQK